MCQTAIYDHYVQNGVSAHDARNKCWTESLIEGWDGWCTATALMADFSCR